MDEKIIAMQQPSTQKALKRPEAEDSDWFFRPLPKDWRAVKDAKTWEEAVGARAMSFKEAQLEQDLRYNRGAILSQMRKEEERSKSTLTETRRGRAVEAFMFVKAKFKDIMRAAGLAPEVVYEDGWVATRIKKIDK